MKNLTLASITEVTGGRYSGPAEKLDQEVEAITTDSRKAGAGSLFAAIRGERSDGNSYIPDVIGSGAMAVLTEREPEEIAALLMNRPGADVETVTAVMNFPIIVVESVLNALKDIAELYRRQLRIPVIGIIGSAGKTSTKEMTAAVLSRKFRVLKTEGNFNNELGVPLTLFRIREEDQIAVVEMGINHFGEMHRLAKMARPDAVIMTNIGTAHLEFLKTRDGILEAKSEVFDYMDSNARILLNGDDDKLATIQEKNGAIPVRFGLDPDADDIYADGIVDLGLEGTDCTIHTPEGSFDVRIPCPGRHMVYNALAGCAAGLAYGMTFDEIREGIASYRPLKGRFSIVRTDDLTLIDDCYNANPDSMKASLDILAKSRGRRVAILGDMGELGEDSEALHAGVGACAAELGIDVIICVGSMSKAMAKAALETVRAISESHPEKAEEDLPKVRYFETRDAMRAHLDDFLQKNDIVLVKASHFMHFEQVVEDLGGKP